MDFEWDDLKALLNELKHGIRFDEAVTVFDDPFGLEQVDSKHSSENEIHLSRIGLTDQSKVLFVIFTLRKRSADEKEITRIISARLANRKEKGFYSLVPQDS